ncbi:MAG TPA: hypothetical protein VNI61_05850 [Gemmatimonadales bacterium]|nr:hypothetical protein [Gemmatimonadales bacterium]
MSLRTATLTVLVSCLAAGLPAQTPDTLRDTTARRVAELERELERLRQEVADLAALAGAPRQRPAPDQRYRQASGIGSRPFLYRGAGAAVGGYVDLEFAREFDADQTHFTQHRLIPFIFAEISDRLHFGTEIEFEYGGPQSPTRDGELKVEFASFDLNLAPALNFRAGALLSPLGKFNLVHDSPVNDLTDRPLVANRIIPTTLTEAGAGFWGQLFPSEASVLTYEVYAVNGFNNNLLGYSVTPGTGAITAVTNVRNARGSMRRDNNPGKSLVGRVAFSPALGIEVGASGHTGAYGDGGGGRLTLAALDAIMARGRWELLGEFAAASLSVDRASEQARARPLYVAATGDTTLAGFNAAYAAVRYVTAQRGGYLQFNYHFLQGAVRGFPNSTFTAVVRLDHLDLDADRDGDLQQRLSLGLNWRPIEQSAIKVDYQWNWTTPAGSTTPQPPSHRLVASVATYF